MGTNARGGPLPAGRALPQAAGGTLKCKKLMGQDTRFQRSRTTDSGIALLPGTFFLICSDSIQLSSRDQGPFPVSAIVKEVYDAFRSAGVSDEQATAAARAIPLVDDLATKADIDALRAELRGDMKDLELRMTIKLFGGLGMAVAGVKALDFLIG